MNLGAHMSIAGGAHRALEHGLRIGCSAVQIFVKSTNQWRARPLRADETARFRELLPLFPPGFVIAHASYLLNLASPDRRLLERSIAGLRRELELARELGVSRIAVHPGSHRGSGEAAGVVRVARGIDAALAGLRGAPEILIETTAGQGDTLGSTFEQIARIVDRSRRGDSLGVCLDTCHVFAAGYDLRDTGAYERTLERFDAIVGLERLRAFHLNDSLGALGSRIDRHAHIGAGAIGARAFGRLVNDARFLDRPMILETPKGEDDANDLRNLAVLRAMRRLSRRRPTLR